MSCKRGRGGHKPGSVLPVTLTRVTLQAGQLSIWDACYQTPLADFAGMELPPPYPELEKDQPLLLPPCSRPGFTEPTPLDAAGALLPHLCTLTETIANSELSRRYLSVALSSRLPALGVTQQVWSLGSPDFPQTTRACNCLRLLFPCFQFTFTSDSTALG